MKIDPFPRIGRIRHGPRMFIDQSVGDVWSYLCRSPLHSQAHLPGPQSMLGQPRNPDQFVFFFSCVNSPGFEMKATTTWSTNERTSHYAIGAPRLPYTNQQSNGMRNS